MSFSYRMNEATIELPGELQKDESMSLVHFLNQAGQRRRMIVSREMLAADADFQAVVQNQINALKKEKIMRVGDIPWMTISDQKWPAASIDAYTKMGKGYAWQFHVAFHWNAQYLITISLNAEEEMSADEKAAWLQRIERLEFRS